MQPTHIPSRYVLQQLSLPLNAGYSKYCHNMYRSQQTRIFIPVVILLKLVTVGMTLACAFMSFGFAELVWILCGITIFQWVLQVNEELVDDHYQHQVSKLSDKNLRLGSKNAKETLDLGDLADLDLGDLGDIAEVTAEMTRMATCRGFTLNPLFGACFAAGKRHLETRRRRPCR